MKKILLLLACTYAVVHCNAQQEPIDSILNRLRKHPQEDTVRLDLLYNTAMAYVYNNPDEGIKTSNEGISVAGKLKNEIDLGKLISSKGINYMAKGEYDSALLMLKTSVQIFEKNNYERGLFSALNTIGTIQFYTADYAGALNTCSRNLRIAERSNDTNQIIVAIGNLSPVFRALSNYTEALTYNLKAIEVAEKSNNKTYLANIYGEVGLTYRELKETDKAEQYYQKALTICIQTENKRDEATMLSALGQIWADKKNYPPALSYYKQALQISDSTGNIQTQAGTLGNIGDVYKNISDYPNAINYYKKALLLSQNISDKNATAYLSGELGNIYTKTPQQNNLALSYLQQSLSLAKKIGALDRQETALNYLSSFYEKQKNYQQALYFNRKATVIQDSMFNDTTKQQITRLEMQYQFTKTQDSIKIINDKQQALAKAEIQKQHVIEASTMAGTGFLVLAGIGGFVFYKRNRDIRIQKNEAELQAQITDTEMKALRAQMNPHFIFNSLNSISYYMIQNDTQKADEYLTKFAKLMRLILENSEQKEVSLANDLKALELYMQLEALRLQNKFTYEIKVANDIDKDNTLIPPLILQPFVENSIWHGLTKKNGEGKIIIRIQKENNMLSCTVEDNGIGRESAKIYNEQDTKAERKSVGLKITNARIDVINKLKNSNAAIILSDLSEGTKAEVKLPLELSF